MRPQEYGDVVNWRPNPPLGVGGLDLDSLQPLRLADAIEEALDLPGWAGASDLGSSRTWGALVEKVRARLPEAGGSIVIVTSGSTGRPKRVRYRSAVLAQEVH